jgi:hypothetical protein
LGHAVAISVEQSITLTFASPQSINEFRFMDGHEFKSGDDPRPGRTRILKLKFSEGSEETIFLKDEGEIQPPTLQEFKFANVYRAIHVQVSIKETYHEYKNGATEIEFWGPGERHATKIRALLRLSGIGPTII